MNNTLQEQKITLKINANVEKLVVAAMYVFAFLMYCFPERESIIGPLLAASMMLTVFTEYYYAAPLLCLLGNNSLETILLGRIQVLYLAFPLILLRALVLKKRTLKVSFTCFVCYLSVLAMMGHLYIFDEHEPTRTIIYTVLWMSAMVYIFNDFYMNKKSINPIIFHMGLAIFVSAFQFTLVTLMGGKGGVLYHANVEGGLARYGVFGAGAGDPNCSGMYLLIGFFILLFYCKQLKWGLKIPMLACFALPIFYTSSATTFMFLILICLFYVIFVPFASTKIKIITCILLSVLLLFVIVYFFNIDYMRFLQIDEVARFLEKLQQVQEGEFSNATTGRTSLWRKYIEYYISQPAIRILFGGNSVRVEGIRYGIDELVSHNTYIDFFIRFGLFAGLFLTAYVIYNIGHAFYVYIKTKKDTELCFLRLLVAGFSFTVSYFVGPLYVLIVVILLFLRYDDFLPPKTLVGKDVESIKEDKK